MRYVLIVVAAVLSHMGLVQPLYSFENELTHPAITEKAAFISILDGYLRGRLGLPNGLQKELDMVTCLHLTGRIKDPLKTKRTVLEWLREG